MPKATSDVTHSSHYADVASHYDEHVFYKIDGPLVQWQLDVTYKKLDLQPGLRLVDIGGGTGGFTHELARRLSAAGDKCPSVTLVEPSDEMLDKARKRQDPPLEVFSGDGLAFCAAASRTDDSEESSSEAAKKQKTASCDRVLLKEVVHHIPVADREETFKRLYEKLSPGGRVVIVTRPADVSYYPFPNFFVKYWKEHQPCPEGFEELMKKAGFQDVATASDSFPLRIKRPVWFRMLHQRFWSWLALFPDEDINRGIEELEKRFPVANGGDADFCFDEKMLFIVGTKPL